MKIFTRTKGYFELHKSFWGTCYRSLPYEEGEPDSIVEEFKLQSSIKAIPKELWDKMITIFSEYNHLSLEISSCLLFNKELDKWRIVIPKQEVTISSCKRTSFKAYDIESESLLEDYSSSGYIMVGDCHLHPYGILGKFSSVDDLSELKSPGFHILIHSINNDKYEVLPSITKFGTRYKVLNAESLLPISSINKLPIGIKTNSLYKNLVSEPTIQHIKASSKSLKPLTVFTKPSSQSSYIQLVQTDFNKAMEALESKYGILSFSQMAELFDSYAESVSKQTKID